VAPPRLRVVGRRSCGGDEKGRRRREGGNGRQARGRRRSRSRVRVALRKISDVRSRMVFVKLKENASIFVSDRRSGVGF
jgi:hypothetical protein